jgi:pimeloyl-ACP methyl ester carboxylesterase
LKPARIGLTIGLGAGALASAGYASAVGLARRQSSPPVAAEEVEAILDKWLGELGQSGVHRYAQTPVGRIHALELGHGPRALVFLHGLGASVGEYSQLAARLATQFRVIGIDRPGSGLSDPIEFDGHPRPAWNQAVSAVVDQLGIDRFDLVGHSLGGLAAGGYAIDHQDRVRRLVLLSPVGISSRLPLIWSMSMFPGMTDVLGAAARLQLARQTKDPGAPVVEAASAPPRVDPDLARYRYLVGLRFTKGADLEAVPRLMRPFGFRPETLLLPGLDALAERTLVVWGDRDNQVSLAPAQAELLDHPGITLKVLEGAGHLFPFEDPASTAADIARWCHQDQEGG